MGKFEITLRKNGEFQFNLKASNGEIILTLSLIHIFLLIGSETESGATYHYSSLRENRPSYSENENY